MKKIAFIIILLFLSAPLALAQRQLLDRVVAVVNDEVITQSELDAVLRPIYEDYRNQFSQSQLVSKLNEARQKLLNQLIEDRLVYQEAKAKGLKVPAAELEQQMKRFQDQFETNEEFEDAISSEGLSRTALEERLRRQALIRELHNIEIRSKIVVSPKDVEEYYQKNPDEFSSEETIKIRSFTIKKSSSARQKGLTDETAKDKVLEIRQKIIDGGNFGELAKENSEDSRASDGGLSDWISRGNMIPVIDDVIFALKDGEISELVETPMGYHFFLLEVRKPGHKKSLEESRDEIFDKLFSQQAEERFKEWMDELKSNSYISIR